MCLTEYIIIYWWFVFGLYSLLQTIIIIFRLNANQATPPSLLCLCGMRHIFYTINAFQTQRIRIYCYTDARSKHLAQQRVESHKSQTHVSHHSQNSSQEARPQGANTTHNSTNRWADSSIELVRSLLKLTTDSVTSIVIRQSSRVLKSALRVKWLCQCFHLKFEKKKTFLVTSNQVCRVDFGHLKIYSRNYQRLQNIDIAARLWSSQGY